MMAKKKFYLDRRNGKFMGVCAGVANHFNIDATIVRVALVLVTLMGAAPWTLIAYLLAGWLAKPAPQGRYVEDDVRTMRGGSTYDLNQSMRDIDRRLAEVDSYVASSNGRLAREIEELK